jgi:hypothetical protein
MKDNCDTLSEISIDLLKLLSCTLVDAGVDSGLAAPLALEVIGLYKKSKRIGVEKTIAEYEKGKERDNFWWITWHPKTKSAKKAWASLRLKYSRSEILKTIKEERDKFPEQDPTK